MDLVKLDDEANGVGVTLFKTVEAFLFSTSVELTRRLHLSEFCFHACPQKMKATPLSLIFSSKK